ncbi:uncharacterized protein LOC116936585 [Daphnia magna]|uniref:uncharacterized protein LOC116936585 n=1 Tax=Daphnia magna TaxID=35525 RepID=UPI001401F546|nr:uncharacterized protein LOC116936585 [Daphnia magna]XP_045034674.1 uncharacterized protein LOC116936585 [Daphnia magna]XP_045034676.1 uncharacterized protein LOC116936585 [Daphnia magna]
MAGLIAVLSLLAFIVTPGLGMCFFPAEFQGEYMTQSSSRGGVNLQYAPISILPESIPVWGVCHRRFGNRVILMDRTGGTNCIRCFELTLRSLNVVQIHTEGLDKCYTTEEAAMATCPTDESIATGKSREIMLYKTKELTGDPVVAQEYCPVNGRFVFTYSVNDGLADDHVTVAENVSGCQEPVSELSNCPYGFGLGLRFKRCSFGELEINFQCLGDWIGHNGERYMALLDVQDSQSTTTLTTAGGVGIINGAERRPRYRCALYKEDPETSKMYVALSSDSTCTNDLRSPKEGYETLVLTSIAPPPLPFEVSTSSCRFPSWAHGQWQDAYVEDDTLIYKDLRNFKTYTLKCMVDDKTLPDDQGRFVVYARTQCGDDFYTCLTVEKRGVNVMEFQLGAETSTSYNQSLCQNEKFPQETWVTQGRITVFSEEACPISGEYTGVIPDAVGLCAKLYSDCRNPQRMFYSVSNCHNLSEVYEEREYRCLGKFTDRDLTYTYTERRDVLGYECFVGVIINDGELFIKEAGEHCQRDVEPLRLGMKVTRQATCYTPRPSAKPNAIATAATSTTNFNTNMHPSVVDSNGVHRPASSLPPHNGIQPTTIKTWKPVTDSPMGSSGYRNVFSSSMLLMAFVAVQLLDRITGSRFY